MNSAPVIPRRENGAGEQRSRFVIVFSIGGVIRPQGLDVSRRAAAHYRAKMPVVNFHFCPTAWESDRLEWPRGACGSGGYARPSYIPAGFSMPNWEGSFGALPASYSSQAFWRTMPLARSCASSP